MNVTLREISTSGRTRLFEIKSQLMVDQMKLDRFFSVFLNENEMTEEDLDTPEWITYREMTKNYADLQRLIKTTDYYITQNG